MPLFYWLIEVTEYQKIWCPDICYSTAKTRWCHMQKFLVSERRYSTFLSTCVCVFIEHHCFCAVSMLNGLFKCIWQLIKFIYWEMCLLARFQHAVRIDQNNNYLVSESNGFFAFVVMYHILPMVPEVATCMKLQNYWHKLQLLVIRITHMYVLQKSFKT